ncbi:MAG: copper amine oxidase N-terminal domain-containing protein [Clostridia bacterium]|nr:copper amine oxidase N-terminal domain-containing protein [Clostridia bacterium]
MDVGWDGATQTVTLVSSDEKKPASAAAVALEIGNTEITAQLRPDFTIIINGAKQTFTDANNVTVYPVLYNGTTYLPLRAVGNSLGMDVGWDGATQTVTLTKKTEKPAAYEGGTEILFNGLAWGSSPQKVSQSMYLPNPLKTDVTIPYFDSAVYMHSVLKEAEVIRGGGCTYGKSDVDVAGYKADAKLYFAYNADFAGSQAKVSESTLYMATYDIALDNVPLSKDETINSEDLFKNNQKAIQAYDALKAKLTEIYGAGKENNFENKDNAGFKSYKGETTEYIYTTTWTGANNTAVVIVLTSALDKNTLDEYKVQPSGARFVEASVIIAYGKTDSAAMLDNLKEAIASRETKPETPDNSGEL